MFPEPQEPQVSTDGGDGGRGLPVVRIVLEVPEPEVQAEPEKGRSGFWAFLAGLAIGSWLG